MRRLVSFLLALVLVLSMVPAVSFAAEPFDTENFKGLVLTTSVSGISVKLFEGYADDAPQVTPVYTETNAWYFAVEAGGQYYYTARPSSGYSRYHIRENIYVTEAEANTKMVLDVTPHTRSTSGWDTFEPVKRFSDETMAAAFPSSPELWPEYAHLFSTPVFTNARNPHKQTTQTEMMNYISGLDTDGDHMYVYVLGKSGGSKSSEFFDIPVVFYSQTDLSGAATWEEAAERIRANGKLTVLYQAQIHGKETGGGEAAMAMLKEFDGSYGEGLLSNMNICVIPRLNTWGAYKSDRSVYANGAEIDANRDFLKLDSNEVQLRTKLYQAVEPEVCFDGHEYFVRPERDTVNMKDMMLSTNYTPTATDAYREMALTLAYKAFERAEENNLTYGWYDGDVNGYNGNIGSTNSAMRGSLMFLTETQGILGGNHQLERRMMGHISMVTGVLDYVNENVAEVQQVVDAERQSIVNRGKTYEESDIVILSTGGSQHPEFYMNGKKVTTGSGEITDTVFDAQVYDVVKASRTAPTAYVIPAGESWTEAVLAKLDIHGIGYTYIPAGSQVALVQYTGTIAAASLTEERTVSFPKGAYVMTMAQEDAYILALLMEPDVKDVSGDNGTFAQQGLIPSENGTFPIYRYIHDLNSQVFIDYTVETVPVQKVTVYLDPVNGSDTGSGLAETAPVKTVEAAYATLTGADEGVIVLQSTLTVAQETTFPTCNIPVTITGGEIKMGGHLLMGGDTLLDNLTLTLTASNNTTYLSAEGHDLTIGENVTTKLNGSYRLCLTGRYGEGSVEGMDLTVKAGIWQNIMVAGYKSNTWGNASLTMVGGEVKNLLLPTYSGNVEGNTTLNLYGGTIQVAGVAPNQTGTITGNVDMNLGGGVDIKKVRIRRDLSGSNIQGTATVTVDGDCSGIGLIEHINPTGKITKTRLVLKRGILAVTPCTFDEVLVQIPSGETFTLSDCDITATTVNSQGTLLFSGKASLCAEAVTGTLSCDISGDVVDGQLYVTAPTGSAVTFPTATGITETGGAWRAPGAIDESTFKGLVLRADKGVSVKLYTGYKDGSVVAPIFQVEGETQNSYYYNITPGNYRSRTSGSGYYSTSQMIYVSEAKLATCTVYDVTPDKRAGGTTKNNWEPSEVLLYTEEMMNMDASNGDTSQWPEYADVFTTPWFTEDHGPHQQTTQAQLENFIFGMDDPEDDMYIFSIGQSAHYGHTVWAVIFTETDLSSAKTLEEATAMMVDDKPTVLYRAQIHGDESAACEGALAMIQRMDGAYGKTLTDDINVVILPRTNPDGAQNYKRNLHNDLEPNRDSVYTESREISDFVRLYNLLMPEVVIDGHEYAAYSYEPYLWDADVLVGAGFTTVNTPELEDVSTDMVLNTFQTLGNNGLTYRCYEQNLNASNPGVNRVYASKRGSLSFLLETRGNKAGTVFYARRVVGQVIAAGNLLEYTAANADLIVQTVANERASVVERGKTYDRSDVIPLTVETVKVDDLSFSLDRIYQNGTVKHYTYTPSVWSNVTRSRVAPTAYVIPAGAPFAQQVLGILEEQAITYTYIPGGSVVMLQQYTGTGDLAELTEEKAVTFPEGAYVFTMNQEGAIILSTLMEPDIKPGSSLVWKGIVEAENGVFPIYRYVHDLNAAGFIDYTVSDAVATHVTVYLDGTNGMDTNDGMSAGTAVKTLEQAYGVLTAALQGSGEGSRGTIVISGLYELGKATYHFPTCNFPVTVTGKTTDDGLSFTGGSGEAQIDRAIHLHGETTFQYMRLHVNNGYSYNYIFANGHKLVLGKNLNTTVKKTNYYFAVSGGSVNYGEQVESVDVTIRSGSWKMIYLGGYYGDVKGHAKLNISNAKVLYSIVPSYRGNVGSVEMNISNTAVTTYKSTDTTHGIFAGTYTANSNYNCGKILGDVTIRLGENVTAPAVYGTARLYGRVWGNTTIIAEGIDLSAVPVYARYSGLSSAYATGYVELKLQRDITADVTVDPALTLNLNGCDITGGLTVDGTLTVYDTSTDDYLVEENDYGQITGTVTGTLKAKEGYLPAGNGFHKFHQYISAVTLRPGNAGIYYTATILCDEILAAEIETCGVAVSLTDLPGADFATDADTLYTEGTFGRTQNGVLIQNILRGDPEDPDRAIMDIYAASYVKLKDGTVLVSSNEVAYSLFDVLCMVKAQNPQAYESFCKEWNLNI